MTTLATMYPGQTNSPSTTLSGALSANATTVNVVDASVLPSTVPFPLTIGIDSSQSETVLVTAINGNALTVVRGWDGTSSGWAVDTPVARVLTARDLNELQANVAALNADKAPASSVPSPSTSSPNMDGTGSAGSASAYSRGDHRHPTDTSRQPKITASGLLKGDGNGGVTAAVAGTDYAAPSAIPSASTSTPQMDGTGSYGSGTAYARSNHVHPTDTSRQAKITASGLLKGDGNGGVTAAAAGTDYQTPLVAGTDYATPASVAACIPFSEKGANSGVATLDSYGKLTADQATASGLIIDSSRSLQSSDAGKFLYVNGAYTLTIPATLANGTEIVVVNYAGSNVTVTAASGVTLNGVSQNSVLIPTQYTAALLKAVTATEWEIFGAIA